MEPERCASSYRYRFLYSGLQEFILYTVVSRISCSDDEIEEEPLAHKKFNFQSEDKNLRIP